MNKKNSMTAEDKLNGNIIAGKGFGSVTQAEIFNGVIRENLKENPKETKD